MVSSVDVEGGAARGVHGLDGNAMLDYDELQHVEWQVLKCLTAVGGQRWQLKPVVLPNPHQGTKLQPPRLRRYQSNSSLPSTQEEYQH